MGRDVARRVAMAALAKGRIVAGVDVALRQGVPEMGQGPKILIVPKPLFREQRMQGMVEAVVPLRIQSISPESWSAEQARVVQVTLGNQIDLPLQTLGLRVHDVCQFCQEGVGRTIHDGVYGVEPQGIDMARGDPVQGTLNEKLPDLITVWPVEVEAAPPRGLVALRKIRAKIVQIIAFRTEVVIHHIQHHSQAALMTGIDQPLKSLWPAVRGLRGKRIDAIVAPVTAAGK